MLGWGRSLLGCPVSCPASAAHPGKRGRCQQLKSALGGGLEGARAARGSPGSVWPASPVRHPRWRGWEVSLGTWGPKGEWGGPACSPCAPKGEWGGPACSPCALAARGSSSPRPPTGTSQPGNGCQGCLASLAPDSNYRAETGSRRGGTAPRVIGGEKQLEKHTWLAIQPMGGQDWGLRGPGCHHPSHHPSQHAPLHLQVQLPRALLDLILRLHVEHLSCTLPVDGDNDIPWPEVTRSCLPMLRHLQREGDMRTSPLLSWSHPPSLNPRHAGGKNGASPCVAFVPH